MGHRSFFDFRYQSISRYRLILIDIGCHRLSILLIISQVPQNFMLQRQQSICSIIAQNAAIHPGHLCVARANFERQLGCQTVKQ